MGTDVRVGIIDSGCSPEQANRLLGARRFWLEDGQLREGEIRPDQLGHGSAVLAGLQREAGPVPLLVAQVFGGQASTSALQVAAGLLWLVEAGATLVNLSLGLQQDRPVLHQPVPKRWRLACCCVHPARRRVSRCTRPATPGCSGLPGMPVARPASGPGWAPGRQILAVMSGQAAGRARVWVAQP